MLEQEAPRQCDHRQIINQRGSSYFACRVGFRNQERAGGLSSDMSGFLVERTERRTLGAEGVENWLARFISREVSGATNKIRDAARDIAGPLELESEFKQLDKTIGALLGTQRTHLTAAAAIARAAGKPYDDARVTLFQTLALEVQANPLHIPTVDPSIDSNLQAFIETYFSNYIEGTEFEIEEAHDIVVQGRPLQYREDDSHDPFTDGNGRTARLATNLFLTEAGLTRIIIPTVFRDDDISALKAMSSNSLPTPLMRMLARAARFSHWVNMSSKASAFADLKRSNALGRPETDKLSFDDSLASAPLEQ